MSEAVTARRDVGLLRVGVVGIAGVVLMWLSVAVTLAMTVPEAQPDVVVALWPSAAIARNAEALKLMVLAGPRSHREALALAGSALAREPVLAAAASALGAAAGLGGDNRRAVAAYGYAQRLSRRDLPSQLWSIERAVARGDVAGALAHYDITLRANPPFVDDTLLPVLARASAGSAVRAPLIGLLARKPRWRTRYLQTALAASLPPAALAEQLAGARLDPADPVDATILSDSLGQLVQAKQYRLAAAMLPGVRGGLRNGSFEQVPSLLPFDWWLATDDDLSAYREPSGASEGAYVLRVASKERGGVIARQLVALPPGRWMLTAIIHNDEAGDATPSIKVACADGQKDLIGTIQPLAPASGKRRFTLAIVIPVQECAAQWLTVETPAGATTSAWIDAIEFQQGSGSTTP